MKTKVLFITIIMVISSCKDEEFVSEIDKTYNPTTTRSVGDGKYDLLGYGYNCFYSDFKDPLYAKSQVIDLERLEKGLGRDPITGQEIIFTPSKIEISTLHGKTEMETVYGSSIETLTKNMNVHASTSIGTKILKLFSLDLEATINSGQTEEKRNAFYRIEALKLTRRITLPYTTPSRLKYFFTDEFLSDLKQLSGRNIIEKYGTHVLTDILLGGKFSALYTGQYTSTEENQLEEFRASSEFLFSSIKANTHYDSKAFNSFKNVHIYIKSEGGSETVVSTINQDVSGKLENVSFNYTSWINSVTTKTESLISIGNPDTKIYLLSEFIDDPAKKKQIEMALSLREVNYTKVSALISPYSKFNNNKEEGKGVLIESIDKKGAYLVPIRAIVGGNPMSQYCIFTLYMEDDYVTFKRRDNDYLDNTCKYSPKKNDKTQHWKMEYVGSEHFKLKNMANNKYLSSFDLKYYDDSTEITDSLLYWRLL